MALLGVPDLSGPARREGAGKAPVQPFLQGGRWRWTHDRPRLMGVLNLTPDSFSDGGQWVQPEAALVRARQMLAEGADLIDLGAESTRPGADPVPLDVELARLIPVLGPLVAAGVPVSVDTQKPEVMRVALEMGADMINDVAGFASPQAVAAVRHTKAAVCVMHKAGDPRTMQDAPTYNDVVAEVQSVLAARVAALCAAGVAPERILIDPGLGFGKTLAHNLSLLARLSELRVGHLPILVGVSRKSMVGALTGRPVHERLPGSLAAMLAAVAAGAQWVRVHDVAASRDALLVWHAMADAGQAATGP